MPIRRRTSEESAIQMTPMIDMTFLLLIFFLVTSKITNEQKKLEIRLPIATAGTVPDDASGREIINIDGEGRFYTGDRLVDEKQLRAFLKQRLIDVPPLKVYVRADAQTPAKQIKDVMKICTEAGAIEVIFGTYKKK
ncbi:MAG: biopolymer transporter ExbD [Candidatus Methylacidiphilales bacterium]